MSPRAPFLTAPDYVFYLRRQVDKERAEFVDNEDAKENSFNGSMDMPKLSDLLHKLSEDLRGASAGFVDDFVSEPNSGLTWLLDILRLSLNRQQCPGMVVSDAKESASNKGKLLKTRDRQHLLKRAMADEYDCLVCLKQAAQRSAQRTLAKILSHRNGLSTLASCIVSNLTKSRIIALQLLTSVCNAEPDGASKILEAMSTMRIVFGESVRFKLLVSILNSASLNGIESYALAFINTILAKSSSVAERVRLQCELEEAGLDVELLEKRSSEKDLPPDDAFWSELKQWNDTYIDVVEVYQGKRAMVREVAKLKEEIDLLQRALTKLEEDKISLMQIERELKEKCEDYEQEVTTLRSRLSNKSAMVSPSGQGLAASRRSGHKAANRPGSDSSDPVSGTADSGRWSDSDGCDPGGLLKVPQAVASETADQDPYDTQQNRNEDILIYIPAIRPPANFASFGGDAKSETAALKSAPRPSIGGVSVLNGENTLTHHLAKSRERFETSSTLYKSASKPSSQDGESRWTRRQRGASIPDSPNDPKPTVVEVYPKKCQSVSALDLTEIPMDDGNESDEQICDWNYQMASADSKTTVRTRSERLQLINGNQNQNIVGKHSNSLGELQVHDDYENEVRFADNSQFLLRSRDSFPEPLHNKRSLTHSSSLSDMSCNSAHSNSGLAKLHTGLPSISQGPPVSSKPKNIASSIQSYFFSGTVSRANKALKAEQQRAFPMASLYKKNFITKGHGNCGLYSGVDDESRQGADDGSPLSQNMSKLVHREIAMAAKDLGAWL